MSGRHRKPRKFSKERRRLLGGLSLLAVMVPISAVTLHAAIAEVRSCQGTTNILIGAAPSIEPVLQEHVDQYQESSPRTGSQCISVSVTPIESAEQLNEAEDLDGWIPETALWMALPDADDADQWAVREASLATDPVGVTLPESNANNINLNQEAVNLNDPREDPASLLWLISFGSQDSLIGSDSGSTQPISQFTLDAHNEANPDDELPDLVPDATFDNFEFPYLVNADASQEKASALAHFQTSLNSDPFQELASDAGFEEALPSVPSRDADLIERVLEKYDDA